MLTLEAEQMRLGVEPRAGGSVTYWRWNELDFLRPGPRDFKSDWNPIDYAAFPLVPFSGRIAQGQFKLNNKTIQLPANFPPEPHAIHGHGWRKAWSAQQHMPTQCELLYQHSSDAWPWDYEARQIFNLSPDRLTLNLSVTNRSATPMPAGLGWHPYFPREGANIRVDTLAVWQASDAPGEGQPVQLPKSFDLRTNPSVKTLNLDHAFDVGGQTDFLSWPEHILEMVSDQMFTKRIVYVPPREDYFCVEPATHSPDAVNSRLPEQVTGLKWIAQDETLSGNIEIRFQETSL